MLKIYHNPRCSKSREGLKILEETNQNFQKIEYLKEGVSNEELQEILNLLQIPAEALVRKNEAIWKEKYKGKKLSEEEIVQAMVENPKLMERPIVVKNGKAIIGRPPENIRDFLKK